MQIVVMTVPECPSQEAALAAARAVVDRADVPGADVRHLVVSTDEQARLLDFRGSPTFLVDGADPFSAQAPPVGLSCRIYRLGGRAVGCPSAAELATAIASSA